MKNYFWLLTLSFFLFSCKDERLTEVEEMFKDRPSMRVPQSSKLYREALVSFQGLRWSEESPAPHSSQFTLDGEVKVREGLSPGEAWTVFFFEKYNSQRAPEFEKIWQRGLRGELSREEWVLENTKLEHRAATEFLSFIDTLLLPEFRTLGIDTFEVVRYRESFSQDLKTWMSSPEESYPWNYWGKYYDENFSRQ
jgi:hypothetical protein